MRTFLNAIWYKNASPADKVVIEAIQAEIMRLEFDAKQAENFAHLLNYLNFLDTIASFYEQWDITTKEISELMGRQIWWYYAIFQPLIDSRRINYNSRDWYKSLEVLAKECNCEEACRYKDKQL